MCTVLEVVDFNVAFYLNYLNSLLLTICIQQTPSFETDMILDHLSIQVLMSMFINVSKPMYLFIRWLFVFGWILSISIRYSPSKNLESRKWQIYVHYTKKRLVIACISGVAAAAAGLCIVRRWCCTYKYNKHHNIFIKLGHSTDSTSLKQWHSHPQHCELVT